MSLTLAFQFPYLRFTLIAAALLTICLYFFFKRLSGAYSQLRRKWHPPSPFDPMMLKYQMNAMMFWIPFVLLSAVLLGFAVYLTRYEYVGEKAQQGGTISFKQNSIDFVDSRGRQVSATVKGAKSAAGGLYLRFPKWMKILGLETYQNIVTFRSMEHGTYHYTQPDAEWLEGYADPVFLLFYRYKWWKVPEALYVESPYFSGGNRRIYVTRSGYITE